MNRVLLVGTGQMAIDYANILVDMNVDFDVVGRGKKNADLFFEAIGKKPVLGIERVDFTKGYSHSIIAVSINQLSKVCMQLIDQGIRNILLEKPGAVSIEEYRTLYQKIDVHEKSIYIAYNRRFYQSAIKAREIITEDGGVQSFFFDFTEWAHVLSKLDKPSEIKENWFFINSTHIVDLAFHLAGKPLDMYSFSEGRDDLDWHPVASKFSGAGITKSGATFCYGSDWSSAGRWRCEINTSNYKIIFCPIEKIQITRKGTVKIEELPVDYSIDTKYKPGLYLQTKSFLAGVSKNLKSCTEHFQDLDIYQKILKGK